MRTVAFPLIQRLAVAVVSFAASGSAAAQDDPTAMPDPGADIRAAEQSITDRFQHTEQSITGSGTSTDTTDTRSDSWTNAGSVETTTTSSGHSHSETRSHDSWSDISVGTGGGWNHPAPPNEAIVGRWSLAQDGGDHCTIELKADEWFGGHRAYTPAGCPDGFFDVNRWTVSGNQLQLTDTNNRIIGRFWPAGDGRWSGKRESDGARMSLNR